MNYVMGRSGALVINDVTKFCALSCVLPPGPRWPVWWVHSPRLMERTDGMRRVTAQESTGHMG